VSQTSQKLQIISGGGTGADRAGLDFAIAHGFPHGGWCPKGRNALDGPLHERYRLQETPSSDYPQRTEWNVRDSDGTAVFTLGTELSGGSAKTFRLALTTRKPCVHLHPGMMDVVGLLQAFVEVKKITCLNVAGSRVSKEPGLYAWTIEILTAALL
jgi:hypothetical protein